MARIPQHIVDQIYAAIDIIDVIGDYVQLKKRGSNYLGLSPFKNEKTPSFVVNPKKNIYKDFSSGKGGNAINFIIEMEGYSYVGALRHLAKKYGIEIQEEEEEETEEQKLSRDKRESLFIVNEFAAGWWHDQLMLSKKGKKIGLSYFKERGLLQSTIEDFQLGYAPDAWQALVNAAADRQYKEEFLEELSLATRSKKNGNLFDRFRGRVMFPITNVSGKVVGFGGRILPNSRETDKYINSSASEIYHKSKVLYGLYQARQEIRSKDLCILTEGYMDVILLAQNGIKNVVASSGTDLTLDQIRLIRRFTEKVLMIYDGDVAGVKAALRGIDLLVQEGMKSEVLILPDNHDPDSYIREFGANGFQEYAKAEAMSFVDFKMRVLTEGRDADDPQVQTEVVKALADTLALQDDLVERQMYIKRLAKRLDVTESLMTHAVEQAIKARAKIAQQEAKREEARKARERNKNKPYKQSSQVKNRYDLLSNTCIQSRIRILWKKLGPCGTDYSLEWIIFLVQNLEEYRSDNRIWNFLEMYSDEYKPVFKLLRFNPEILENSDRMELSEQELKLLNRIKGAEKPRNECDPTKMGRYLIALFIFSHSSINTFLSKKVLRTYMPNRINHIFSVLESALELATEICEGDPGSGKTDSGA